MLPVAILAGGLATRIRPITNAVPKSMIDINGQPFLEWQLQLLEKNNCETVVLCVSHKAQIIEDFVTNRPLSKMEIQLSWDGEKQLGTGGALAKAMEKLGSAFLVLYGDSYLPLNYEEVANHFLKSNKLGLMTVMKNELGLESSNVILENGFVSKYSKHSPEKSMEYIDFGLGAFRSDSFSHLNLNEPTDLSVIQADLATRNELVGFEVKERYYEVGSFQGIRDFQKYVGDL